MSEYGQLTILTKLHDMMKYAYPALAQFPKSEKFAIVADIKRCMNAVLERAIEASKKYYKKTTLMVAEIGKMLGGWIRYTNENPPQKSNT